MVLCGHWHNKIYQLGGELIGFGHATHMPKDLDLSDYFFGVVNISENVIYEFNGDDFAGMKVLGLYDLSETALAQVLHKLIVASNIVPFCCKHKIAFLLST